MPSAAGRSSAADGMANQFFWDPFLLLKEGALNLETGVDRADKLDRLDKPS